MANKLLEAALKYASRGLPVFPCRKDKHPFTKNGFKDATIDSEQIKKWWTKWPDASIGMATGKKSGVWVLDADLYKKEAQETYKKLIEANGPLPETRTQQTGGGGKQYFFTHPGFYIKSRNGKKGPFGPGLDLKADGAYVLLPPSGHESGGTYQWINNTPATNAPSWLLEIIKSPPEPDVEPNNGQGKYGQSALINEMAKVSSAPEGTRNETLNNAAYALGQLIAGGEVEYGNAENGLLTAAKVAGLKTAESRRTIQSGFKGGMQHPRTAPQKDDIQYDLQEDSQQDQHFQHNQQSQFQSAKISKNQQKSASDQQKSASLSPQPPHNLKAAIFEFIENSKGSFTTRDIDLEFGLSTRKEKNARSTALRMARENKLIKKDKKAAGKYHIIDDDIEFIDLSKVSEKPFPIKLPFNLHNYASIPIPSIIILAGSTNAGKTTLMLETLRLNLDQKYDLHYYMSEMAGGEYKKRLMRFGLPLSKWEKVKAASKSYNFEHAIEHHNPDGLTCIDYLEEVDGEYFKIASSIREIYDVLEKGVAMIAIQKKRDSNTAYGGEATKQKSRLYLIVDFLAAREHSIVCALKVDKLKEPVDGQKSLIEHELHFEIRNGSKLTVLMDWTPCRKVDRKKLAAGYELERDDIGPNDFVFQTDKGIQVVINQDTAEKWQENMNNINVFKELDKISKASYNKPFVKYSGYFFQLSGILAKHNQANERSNQ